MATKKEVLTLFQAILRKSSQNAPLLLSLCALFWAGNFVVGRGMHEQIPPLAMATLRWLIASALFTPFALPYLKKDWPVIRANLPILLLLGGIGVGGFNSFAYIGLNHTSALNGLIIQSAGPIMIMVTAFVLFGEKVALRQIAGIGLSLVGVFVIVSKANLANLTALELNKGDLWILAAMGIWALYTVLLRKRPPLHAISFTACTFIIGALVNLPFYIWEHFNVRQLHLTTDSALTLAYISIFPSILSYMFYNRGVSLIGGNRAGAFLHLIPLFGSGLAIGLLGETLFAYHAIGFAMILAGVTLAVRK